MKTTEYINKGHIVFTDKATMKRNRDYAHRLRKEKTKKNVYFWSAVALAIVVVGLVHKFLVIGAC